MSLQIDWKSIFVPTASFIEIFIRGTTVYLFLLFVLRILRRQAGALGISDLLVIVLIADAAQNAMASEYKSIPEGLFLVATITFWDYFLDWLGYHVPKVQWLTKSSPRVLIREGKINQRGLQKEMITEDELIAQLREQGVESAEKVKLSYLEGDGHISVIRKDERSEPKRKSTRS